jgi:disulfide bond formation protein DsbB
MTEINLLENLNTFVGVGTLVLEFAVVGLILFFVYLKLNREAAIELYSPIKSLAEKMFGNLERAVLVKMFSLSLFAAIIGLVYSDYFGMIPCGLCWFGRIFTYGVMVISATAIWSDWNSRKMGGKLPEMQGIMKYIINFSVLGILVSIYHYILQMTATLTTSLPCPASGGDCAKRAIFEFGHITFPLMQLLLFVFFVLMVFVVREINKSK